MAESVKVFLESYYASMILSPGDSIAEFYNATSVITRRDRNGDLNSTSTLEGIREVIISSPHFRKDLELSLVDEQNSTLGCVFVVAMGLVKDEDDLQRMFIHSLYLVPSGREEGGSTHAYLIQNDTLLVLDCRNPLQQVTPPSKSQIEIGKGESKDGGRTYASVLGRKSPPGPGSFPPLSSSKGCSSSVAKRCSRAFVDFEEANVKSSTYEDIENPSDTEKVVFEYLKDVEMCLVSEEVPVTETPKSEEGGCASPVPSV